MSSVKDIIRSSLSPFINGVEIDALLDAITEEGLREEKLSVASFNQLSLSTASDYYLDRKAAEVGLIRPDEVGIEDLVFRKLAIDVTATKQIPSLIHSVLETFYGQDAVRAYAQSVIPEPYDLTSISVTPTLSFFMDGKTLTYTVDPNDFPIGSLPDATADDLAAAITKQIRQQGSKGFAQSYTDTDLNQTFVRIYSGVIGPTAIIKVTGGELESVLGFPDLIETTNTNTAWLITKIGSTVRFTWSGNSDPSIFLLKEGNTALIYGGEFSPNNLIGSFPITSVVPGPVGSAYFEIVNDFATIPSGGVTIVEASSKDMMFADLKTQRPNFRKRYALAWEPNSKTLRIYLPAVTQVVKRDLVGSSHIHLGKSTEDFLGTWGSTTDDSARLRIINEYSFSFNQGGADNLGFGGQISFNYIAWSSGSDYSVGDLVSYNPGPGVLYFKAQQSSGPSNGGAVVPGTDSPLGSVWSPASVVVPIDYIRRDSQSTLVVTTEPHGLFSIVNDGFPVFNSSNSYVQSDVVNYGGKIYKALQDNPATSIPPTNVNFWVEIPDDSYLSNDEVTITGIALVQDDPNNSFPSPYSYDTDARYVLTSKDLTLNQKVLAGSSYRTIDVSDTSQIPNSKGYVMFNIGTSNEESPVPIVGTLSGKLIIDPSYKFQFTHNSGEDISYLSSNSPVQIDPFGSDYPFYLTGTAPGRDYCEKLLQEVTALGINLELIIIYPSGLGLGDGLVSTAGFTGPSEAAPLARTDGEYKNNDLIFVYGD